MKKLLILIVLFLTLENTAIAGCGCSNKTSGGRASGSSSGGKGGGNPAKIFEIKSSTRKIYNPHSQNLQNNQTKDKIQKDKAEKEEEKESSVILKDEPENSKKVLINPSSHNSVLKNQLIPEEKDFPQDVKDHWAESYISEVLNQQIMPPRNKNLFLPDHKATRFETTETVVKAFDFKLQKGQEKDFIDIDREGNNEAIKIIDIASSNGVINGYPDGSFQLGNSVSRVEALKILLEASGLDIKGGEMNFKDTKKGQWYEPYIAYAQMNNIINGYPDGSFGPNNKVSRAEVAKMVVEIMKLFPQD